MRSTFERESKRVRFGSGIAWNPAGGVRGWKDAVGIVHFVGNPAKSAATSDAAGTTIGWLPAELCPLSRVILPFVWGNGQTGFMLFSPQGVIQLVTVAGPAAATGIDWSQFSFRGNNL